MSDVAHRVKHAEALGLSPQAAAETLSISRAHLYNLINAGKLKTVKLGNRRVIPRSSVDQLLKSGC